MKKLLAILFLSLFASMMNAATMPIDLSNSSTSVVASMHEHCQESVPDSHHESGKTSLNANAGHYCCSVAAVLSATPVFSSSKQIDVYLLSEVSIPTSNITESIYKPPRNYL